MKVLLTAVLFVSLQDSNCNRPSNNFKPDCEANLKLGLLAYYPFNGNAHDESGNNKHGELKNGVKFAENAKGNASSAALFDGVDDWINIEDNSNYFSRPKMSIAFQVRLQNAKERCNILTKSAFDVPKGNTWGAFVTNELTFRAIGDDENCQALWYDNNFYDLKTKRSLKSNTWYHVCLIFNEGLAMIYLDGKLESFRTNDFTVMKTCTNADLKLGGWWKDDIISMDGKLDELRIYNRVLSEPEIAALATSQQGQ